jgi:tripartite-type tricarboxylate transporter receptor subunit TctC
MKRACKHLILLGFIMAWAAGPAPAGSEADRLAGRTLDVMVGFSNTGGGAKFWQAFSTALRRHLPQTVIRAQFNDTGSGAQGASELYKRPDGTLAVAFVRPPELVFAQINKREGAEYDLAKVNWIAGVERESFIMAARRGLTLDPEALRTSEKQPILPVSDILATQSTVSILLNAVTGITAKIVVGFNNSARLKALLAGDADFYTAAADAELQPLLKSGDLQSLYTIVGDNFPPEVDKGRTLETFLVKGAPQSVVDFIKSARGMGRAFFAPPGVAAEDVAALRNVFASVLTDPEFIKEADSQGIPVAAVAWGEVDQGVKHLMPNAAAKMAFDKAYECGLAMSEGKAKSCEF